MPQQKKKTKFKRGFKKWSDDKTVEIRKELGLFAYSPLCAFDLCNHLEIPIFEPNQIKGLSKEKLDILLNSGGSHWSAATIPVDNEKYIIIHNPNHSDARQQSNLMHELAHILCNHKTSDDKIDLGLSGFLRNHNEEQENEAEWFGACLQLPRPVLLWALKQNMSEKEIAMYYNASMEMVKYRINITGVKRQLSYSKH